MHRSAANYLEEQNERYLDAARHLRLAEDYSAATCLLIEHQKAMMDNLQVVLLYPFIHQFRKSELDDEL